MKPPEPITTTKDGRQRFRSDETKTLALNDPFAWLKRITVAGDACAWNRFVGGVLLALVVLLFLSGAFLAFYYSPVPGAAYDSVDFTLFSAPFGSILKGVHHYAWNLLLVLAIFHLARTFVAGAYRKPRQLTWISGVAILGLLPLFIITGDLLPWDQRGYWSTQVRMSIIASIPFAGDMAVRILQGGALTGIVALTRFYVLHILFLPCLLALLLAVHFYFVARHGFAERLNGKQAADHPIAFFPRVVNRWLVLFIVTVSLIALLTYYWPSPLGDPADPTDSTYVPKPEWWVLFLNQLVAIFKGKWAVLGTAVIPGLLTLFLVGLPYLDRSPGNRPAQRKTVIVAAALLAAVMIVLSLMGYFEHFGLPRQ
ncbi:MAG: cytochrome bc complex cytochrome b subunit [Desulfobacteraceae bacterium]|nr:cytochrome bc complex cytochrome b subunit [Desulfobacteraceae bacterium]MBC2752042.1 cytochrome bc complex cytochrome b subunit [Desulfobacteraceae bacterium]